jgi:predicted PurR-regulated permease PerM
VIAHRALPCTRAHAARSVRFVNSAAMGWSKARDIVWTLLGIAGLLYVTGSVLRLVASGLLLLALGALLAFVFAGPVGLLERRTRLSRGAAAAVVYAVLLAAVGSAGTWGAAALGAQMAALSHALPASLAGAQAQLPAIEDRLSAVGVTLDLAALQAQALAEVQRAGVASQGIAWAGALGISALNAFLVLVLSFYLVVDGKRLAEALLAVAPARLKPYLLFAEKSLLSVVGGYLGGQLAMGAIVGAAVLVLCLVLGVRFSLVLASIAFMAELMPMVGPAITGTAVGLAGITQSPRLGLLAFGLYFLVRTALVYIVGPRILHRTVGVHPIATTLGLVLGARLFGVWGVVFAAPALGFTFVLVEAIYRGVVAYRQEQRVLREAREAAATATDTANTTPSEPVSVVARPPAVIPDAVADRHAA